MNFRHPHRNGRPRSAFTLLEVLIALVILGIISGIYMYTSHHSRQNAGKAVDWQAESAVIEKTIEGFRTGYTRAQLQNLPPQNWVDNSNGVKIEVTAVGGMPDPTVGAKYGFSPDKLAQVTVTAHRQGFPDSITVTTYLWVN